jgi:hypothetical protein
MLAVTAADRSLAADLGLFLVRLPPTDEDRAQAVDEHWLVKSVLTCKIVGRIRFTAVDSLYVTKYGAGASAIEETIFAALRWLTRVDRHVRTGQYAGVEVVIRRFASMRQRSRALTECGRAATDADYSPIEAESELINGRTHEMCPVCREKLEARGVGNIAQLSAQASSTARQLAYLRSLLDEAARNGRPYLVDTALDTLTRHEASALIDRCHRLRERDWKGSL